MATDPKSILLIDDDADFVEATRIVLESRDYRVAVALDGVEGLRLARQARPDLIILDVIMPFKDGFTVCEELKRDPVLAEVPVLMLTSFAERHGDSGLPVSAGFGLEAEDYLDKPAPPGVLLSRVERLLSRYGRAEGGPGEP
ncbi:MAG: response regulator [Armatimonadetes bacterium]|nr:response regulator [Armatimonadota bacterium]